MPTDFIYETAITIDHEDGIMLVDTTVRGVAANLLRAGFEEVTKATSAPYRRFRGAADQLRFRRRKGQRRLGASRETLAKAREARLKPPGVLAGVTN